MPNVALETVDATAISEAAIPEIIESSTPVEPIEPEPETPAAEEAATEEPAEAAEPEAAEPVTEAEKE